MSNTVTEKPHNDFSHLMMDYASGALDEGLALVMASYVSLSPYARDQLRAMESIGGALLCNDCTPAKMNSDSLDAVLAQLDDEMTRQDTHKADFDFPYAAKIPAPVMQRLAAQSRKQPRWTKAFKGMEVIDVPLSRQTTSHVRLMKVAPGIETPEHSHQGMELTLVLDGAFTDETGSYGAGAILLHDDESHHAPVACPKQGCICVVATESPVRFTRGWMKLLNPFLK